MGELGRPIGFEYENKDCLVRALSLATNKPYKEVHEAWKKLGRKTRHGFKAKYKIQNVAKILSIDLKQVKRSGTVQKLIKQYPNKNLFCLTRNHAFPIINGTVFDLKVKRAHIKGAWLVVN